MAHRIVSARDLARIAVFAALIAALGLPGQLSLGSSGVPITLQTLGVMLAGAILGPWNGLASVAVFQVVGLALPVFAGGRTTIVAYSSPTVGYAIGWFFGVVVIGLLTRMILPTYRMWAAVLVTAVGGIGVIYLFGTLGLMIRGGMPLGAAIAANGTFVIGDVLKVIVTVVVADQVHRSYPGLLKPLRPAIAPSTRTAISA